jgi:hypothetical protein
MAAPLLSCTSGTRSLTVRSRLTRAAARVAPAVVGNSAHTLERFPAPRTDAILTVAYRPVELGRLRAADRIDPGRARAALGIPAETGPVLGVIGYLSPLKAQVDAVHIRGGPA